VALPLEVSVTVGAARGAAVWAVPWEKVTEAERAAVGATEAGLTAVRAAEMAVVARVVAVMRAAVVPRAAAAAP